MLISLISCGAFWNFFFFPLFFGGTTLVLLIYHKKKKMKLWECSRNPLAPMLTFLAQKFPLKKKIIQIFTMSKSFTLTKFLDCLKLIYIIYTYMKGMSKPICIPNTPINLKSSLSLQTKAYKKKRLPKPKTYLGIICN